MPLFHESKLPEAVESNEEAAGECGDACDYDGGLAGSGETAGLGAVDACDGCEDAGEAVQEARPVR